MEGKKELVDLSTFRFFHDKQICQMWEKLNVFFEKKTVIQILQAKVTYGNWP